MKLEIFLDKAKKPRIRLRASNGKILMSSEAYSSMYKARQTAHMMQATTCSRIVPIPIVDLTGKKGK